jgi:hypothetical protein
MDAYLRKHWRVMAKLHRIASIDLSNYNGVARLPSDVERIIVQLLIYCKGSLGRVMDKTHLNYLTIQKVYFKYINEIDAAIDMNSKKAIENKIISTSLTVIDKHVQTIADKQKASDNKILNDTKKLTDMAGATLKIIEQETKKYDATINKLNTSIIQQKELEKLESGPIEDTTIYQTNQNSLLSKLQTNLDNGKENGLHE